MNIHKTRILFVSTDLAGGGAERVITILLQHLDRSRFEVGLVLFKDKREYLLPGDIPVICLYKNGWYDYPKIVWKLSQVYRKWEPDLIVSFLTYTNVIATLAKILSFTKSKLLLSEHGIPSFYVSRKKDLITLLLQKWMPRWFYKYADKVVCVSQYLANDLHDFYKVPLSKIEVIYNPIDIQLITKLSEGNAELAWFTEEIPIIVSVGSLTYVKGYPHLLKAFKQVLTKYHVRLVILGQGDQEQSLKELTVKLGINKDVSFLGFQANPFKYLSHSTLFVLSSLSEALPMVILEAMCCGLPVISTAYPGSSEIITNGVNGILVPMADEKAMAEAIMQLLTNKVRASSMAKECKKRINDFSIEKVTQKYEELFLGMN